jgi:hypothetical protein
MASRKAFAPQLLDQTAVDVIGDVLAFDGDA